MRFAPKLFRETAGVGGCWSLRKRSLVAAVVASFVCSSACSGGYAEPPEGVVVQKADIDTLAQKYLSPADYKDFSAIYGLATDIAAAYSGVSSAIAAYQAMTALLSSGENPPFEQVMLQQLDDIKQKLDTVLSAITNSNWLQAERDAGVIYANAAWAAKATREWVTAHPNLTLDWTSPLGVDVDNYSWVSAQTFMNDSWYMFPSGSSFYFDHRLALPRLTNSIAVRLTVMAALDPAFVQNGSYNDELNQYRDRLGELLDRIEGNYISCYNPHPLPYPPNTPPSVIVLQQCRNSLTGSVIITDRAEAMPGTSAQREASARANLLDELGLGAVRDLRDKLYMLTQNAPAGAQRCASEYGTCRFSGTKTVRYGAQGGFFFRNATSSISCSNTVWGDPARGADKECVRGDLVWTPCVGENGRCYFNGPKVVRYGADGSYVSSLVFKGVSCSNVFFDDPAYGIPKSCDYADPVWKNCAAEGGTCSVSGTKFVRFGFGNDWSYRQVAGPVACSGELFGDPAYGVVKTCEYAVGF
jgi:hypothetical protein